MATSTKTPTIEVLEEAELSAWMSEQLALIRNFLIDHEAEGEMVEAIEQAIEDNESWFDPNAELSGRVQSGSC